MKKADLQWLFASSRGRVAGLRTLSAPLRVVVATVRGLRATVRTRRAMVPQVSAPFPTPSAGFHPTFVTVAHTHRWLTNIDGRSVYLRRRPHFLPYRPYLVVPQSFVPGGTRPTGEVWWTNGIGSRIHNHVRASNPTSYPSPRGCDIIGLEAAARQCTTVQRFLRVPRSCLARSRCSSVQAGGKSSARQLRRVLPCLYHIPGWIRGISLGATSQIPGRSFRQRDRVVQLHRRFRGLRLGCVRSSREDEIFGVWRDDIDVQCVVRLHVIER